MSTKELGSLSPTNFSKNMSNQNRDWKGSSKLVGDKGEKIACEYLVSKGYKILEINYGISFGEVDIIARKKWRLISWDKTIHFVEVKTLAGQGHGISPEDHVDFKKKRKLRQMAEIWLEKNKFGQNYPYQIDVVGIVLKQNSGKTELRYFPNAIEEV